MNRPNHNAIWRLISQKVYMIETWNFDTIFNQVFNLCYQTLESISLIVWTLCGFRQRSNFGNFQHIFHHNFQLRRKFWIITVLSERSSSYLSENTLFQKKIIHKNQLLGEKWKYLGFFCSFFFKLVLKISNFINSDDRIGKITWKS